MKVLLATAAEESWSRELRAEVSAVAEQDRFGIHELTSDPAAADLILFLDPHHHLADWRQRALRGHPLVRQFREKVLVYDERDVPQGLLPGLYVAMPAGRFDPRRHRACAYYHVVNDTRPSRATTPDLLFSFQGRRVDELRDAVLRLGHPRALVEDTSNLNFFGAETPDLAQARRRYLETVGRSKFVLCPRGAGTSSLRLFEAMAAGRVPVVLSDTWVAPSGVDWGACAVRIAERDVAAIPELLEEIEPGWAAMSAASRAAYDEWFAPTVWFHRIVELSLELIEQGGASLRGPWADVETWRAGGREWKKRFRARSS